MHLLLVVVKVCSKKCQIYKKMLREIVALNHITFEKLNPNPCLLCFQGCGFLLLDILATGYVPRFGRKSKVHAKLHTLKQFLELSWYYGMLYLTSIDKNQFFFKYQYWWLLLRKLVKILQYIAISMKLLCQIFKFHFFNVSIFIPYLILENTKISYFKVFLS